MLVESAIKESLLIIDKIAKHWKAMEYEIKLAENGHYFYFQKIFENKIEKTLSVTKLKYKKLLY